MSLTWHRVEDVLPEVGEDVLVFNAETFEVEFGFRSGIDIDHDPHEWIDFNFLVTHWAYAIWPEDVD